MKVKSFLAYHTGYGENRNFYDSLASKYTGNEVHKVVNFNEDFNKALYKILKTSKELKVFKFIKNSEEMKKKYFEIFLPYFQLKMNGQAKTPPVELIEKIIKEKNHDEYGSMTLLEKILSQKNEKTEEELELKTPSSPLKIYKRGTPPPGKHTLQKLLGFYS